MDTGQVVVGVLVVLAAYLIGGIPWGVVIARLTGGPDPRTIGSGRTGGANVMRALGPRLALVSGLLDVGKGVVAVLLAIAVGGGLPLEILAALAAIVGHSRSIWIGFAGGRGIAPAFGGLIVIAPIVALIVIPIFFGVLLISRYSSLSALIASLAAPIFLWSLGHAALAALFALLTLLVFYAHRENISRLLAGTEGKIGQKA